MKTNDEKKAEVIEFFKNAFCADTAKILIPERIKDFRVAGIVEMERKGRVFYVAAIEPLTTTTTKKVDKNETY